MAEEKVGIVEKYFAKIGVAAVTVTSGSIDLGDTLHFVGHTTDFTQVVDSMQVEHQSVQSAEVGQSIGLKVRERVRPHDEVFKVTED
ncbi:MAG: EF-Tu/IF-2/RF-3 family GTPase [Candidatus Glassbacteria bacterium]